MSHHRRASRRTHLATAGLLLASAILLLSCSDDSGSDTAAADDVPADEGSTPRPVSQAELDSALLDHDDLPPLEGIGWSLGEPIDRSGDDTFDGTCVAELGDDEGAVPGDLARASTQFSAGSGDQQQLVRAETAHAASSDELATVFAELDQAVRDCDEPVSVSGAEEAWNVVLTLDEVEVEGADQTIAWSLDGTVAFGAEDTLVLDVAARYVVSRAGDLASTVTTTEIGVPVGVSDEAPALAQAQLDELVALTS